MIDARNGPLGSSGRIAEGGLVSLLLELVSLFCGLENGSVNRLSPLGIQGFAKIACELQSPVGPTPIPSRFVCPVSI